MPHPFAIGFAAWLLFGVSPTMAAPMASIAPRVIVHPAQESDVDERGRFPSAVLRLALEASGMDATLQAFPARATQERNLRLVESRRLDVLWTMPTHERVARLRPIRYPVDAGLLGWRVLLVRDLDVVRFIDVTTRADLAGFTGAQGHDWPDLLIQRGNGLPVLESPTYDGLFELLRRGRVDYVSRSVGEVHAELERLEPTGIRAVPGLLLHYPAPLLFFVHPDDTALITALETGLRAIKTDGRLDALLAETFGPDLARFAAPGHRTVHLDNPLFDANVVESDATWWWLPETSP